MPMRWKAARLAATAARSAAELAAMRSELDRGCAQVGHTQQRMLPADPAPAGPAPPGPAERHVDIPPAGAVIDDHLAHREFLHEPVGLADVPGEHRRLQAEHVAVGDAEQLVLAVSRDNRYHRAERLLR